MYFDSLIEKIEKLDCPVAAGLDPRLEFIPGFILEKFGARGSPDGAAEAVFEFNRRLIDALYEVVPAIKPQCAYYEALGWQGMRTLKKTVDYAKTKGMFVIIDGKRNDIGSTAEAYAAAYLRENGSAFNADALTVNGYLGSDGIKPFSDACAEYGKGIFVLCKTSNKSSGELQDREIGGEPIYRILGGFCEEWGKNLIGKYGYSAVGAVAGATYPEQLAALREKMPRTFFLVPGYGAQGGSAAQTANAFDKNKRGAVINSSRAIICAYIGEGCEPGDFDGAARREAEKMRDAINRVLQK